MSGQQEVITVVAGGKRYSAWTRVQISAAMNEAARSFRLEVAAEAGAIATAWTFKAGTLIEIYAGSDLICKGYVDEYNPSLSKDTAQVNIAGRSKSADLIDSSAEHKTGRFDKKNLQEIGKELDQAGVGITTDQSLEQIEFYQITQGESVFRVLEKQARSQGLTLMGEADGSLKITKAGTKRHAGAIIEGVNLLSGEANHNFSNRHSKYIVKGQKASGSGAQSLEIEAIARDAGVGRNRPIIIIQDDDTTKDKAKKRAKGRRDRAAGASLKASITMQGWRDDSGELWQPNRLIWVQSPFLYITQDMLIESIAFGQDSGGTTAKLSLVDPRTYGGKTSKAAKSGEAWKQDDSEAE
jgi:prophage tail gpP-like protein